MDDGDVYAFKKRMALAHQQYVESLEQLMDDRLSNPLLMFKLKAEAPEKYREVVKVLGVSAPLQMLDKLKELATRDIKAREALEAPAIEGEFKEVGLIVPPPPPVPDNPGPGHPSALRSATPQPPKRAKKQPERVKRR